MKKKYYLKDWMEKNPIATISIWGEFGCALFGFDFGIDDYAITAWCDSEKYSNFTKNKVQYTKAGRKYICKENTRLYLDEFVHLGY